MEKEIIYEGSPSPKIDLGTYIYCGAACLFLVIIDISIGEVLFSFGLPIPIIIAVIQYMKTKHERTTITNKDIISEHGVLSKTTDELLLKRVTDVRMSEPFWHRILGLSTITVSTTDVTDGKLKLRGIPNGKQLWHQLRDAVAEERKNVQEQEVRHVK
jgi:uncharacterized membrane protein YdbT with pleckstrin-like domain